MKRIKADHIEIRRIKSLHVQEDGKGLFIKPLLSGTEPKLSLTLAILVNGDEAGAITADITLDSQDLNTLIRHLNEFRRDYFTDDNDSKIPEIESGSATS